MALSKKGKKNKKIRTALKRQEKRKKQEQNAEVRKQERIAQGLPPVAPKPPKHKTKWAGMEAPLPPPQLIDLIHEFLRDYKYIKAAHGIRTDNQKRPGHNMMLWKGTSIGLPHLNEVFTQWKTQNPELAIADHEREQHGSTKPEQISKTEDRHGNSSDSDSDSDSGSDSDSDSDSASELGSSDSDSSSEDDSDSEVDDVAAPKDQKKATPKASIATAAPSLKRKAAELSSEGSSSDISSDSESGSGSSVSSSSSSSDSDSSAESSAQQGSKRLKLEQPTASGTPAKAKDQKAKAISEKATSSVSSSSVSSSGSGSGSGSESDSDSDLSASETKKALGSASAIDKARLKPRKNSTSDSSATLPKPISPSAKFSTKNAEQSESSEDSTSASGSSDFDSDSDSGAELPPAKSITAPTTNGTGKRKAGSPVADAAIKRSKGENKPFSRIPEGMQVEDRFKSNDYVPYDYANKSHETLSAVRGKGFTKEKNKKKRGQGFRGGMIDIGPSRGVKFDD